MVFANTVNGTAVTAGHILTLFYHGSSLPTSIFGDFISIPSTFQQLSPVSYIEAMGILGAGADRGFGQLFGASAISGSAGIGTYLETFRQWTEYVNQVKGSSSGVVLAFTPIPRSQIVAGRNKGGNIMDPPLENYAAVQVHTQTALGLQNLPDSVWTARKTLFKQ